MRLNVLTESVLRLGKYSLVASETFYCRMSSCRDNNLFVKLEALGCSQVVRQRFLVACTVGSNPTTPANLKGKLSRWFKSFFNTSHKNMNCAKLTQDRLLTTFKTVKGIEMPTETLTFTKDSLPE